MHKRLILIAAATLPLAACATDDYYGGRGYASIGYSDGYYPYSGYYDGFYGPVYDGYWGADDYFYYRSAPTARAYIRGDRDHFRRDNNGDTRWRSIEGRTRFDRGVNRPYWRRPH